MAKKIKPLAIVMWLVGILVSLAVGFGMAGEVLTIPVIPGIMTVVAGWIIVIATLIGVVLAILSKFK